MNKQLRNGLILLVFAIVFNSCKLFNSYDENYVVVLSMDGFRWDYTEMTPTPVLDSIAGIGVKAASFKPAFPSKTFPNHYSLATGLYPDNHGLVNNTFYDSELDAVYRIGDRTAVEDGRFYGGEPIWNTAEKQGVKAATYFWVGSEAPVQGMQPTYWKQYDGRIPNEERIDTVIAWLNLPEQQRPKLLMWYFSEPDGTGHIYGPGAPQTNKMVTNLDSLVGVFIKKMNQLPHADKINFIVLSDHGMAHISNVRYIDLTKHIKQEWVSRALGGNPAIIIDAAEGCEDSILMAIKDVPFLNAWKNEDVPERFNYGKNPRTEDILILADNTWSIGWRESLNQYSSGAHGYDNDVADMKAIFYAMGPDFKKNYNHPELEVVDLYPLLAHLLKLEPAKVDGDFKRVKNMLRK